MKATDVLVEEHRVIERVLNSLENAANRLEKGETPPPEFFLSAIDFMRGFADGCHHQKEEDILFKSMGSQGLERQGCPLGVMLAEHELGRQYTRALQSAVQAIQAGDSTGPRRAIMSSRSYVNLLRQHIYKEDNILFPMADHVIPLVLHDTVWDGFERVERFEISEGLHDKFLALADQLEQTIAA